VKDLTARFDISQPAVSSSRTSSFPLSLKGRRVGVRVKR